MKPLRLYTRTTLLTAAVLAMVMLLVAVFFVTRLRNLEQQNQERNAKLLAIQLANLLAYTVPREIPKMQARAQSFFEVRQQEVREIRIYLLDKTVLREEIRLSAGAPEEIAAKDIAILRGGDPLAEAREIAGPGGRQKIIVAIAPIFERNAFRGAVRLTTPRTQFSDLSRRVITLTMLLLAAAILSVVALFYVLFSKVLYRPVEDFLRLTAEVRGGNLDVAAPVRAPDEFGELAVSFNHMISRLRAMTDERAAYQKDLEDRVQDATLELAERNAQLEDANATLYDIQRELTQFERLAAAGQLAAQFAHEVGTPLNLISGHVQLLAGRAADPKTRERLDLIRSQIERIERIVRNMLDATRRPRPALEPTDVNALLRKIFEVTAPTLTLHQVEGTTELAPDLPAIRADGEQLQQVFINLINNSLDAMPAGGRLRLATARNNGSVEITCADTGQGIRADLKSRIFDPLFTTKERGRGSGLGLSVVQEIIREHGGEIEVESDVGAGAEFKIRLPIEVSAS
jgi:two-component system, NtrC family, sensor kinase